MAERRVLLDEVLEQVEVYPNYLQVKVAGSPALIVNYQEVGLKESQTVGVGGGT